MRMVRIGIAAAASSALLVGGSFAPAHADGHRTSTTQDGLVNVNVSGVTVLEDSPISVAVLANVVATLCDTADVGPVAAGVLGRAIATDNSGRDKTICMSEDGPVTLTQNVPS